MTRGVPSDGKPVVQGTWQVHASLSRSSGGARAAGLDNRGRKGMSWEGGWWLEPNDQVEPRSARDRGRDRAHDVIGISGASPGFPLSSAVELVVCRHCREDL